MKAEEEVQQEAERRKKKEESDKRKEEQNAILLVKKAIMRVQVATPETAEIAVEVLENTLLHDLWRCGSLQDKLRQEAEKQIDKTSQRIEGLNVIRERDSWTILVDNGVPLPIADPDRVRWLTWKLAFTEPQRGVPAEIAGGCVKVHFDADRELTEEYVDSAYTLVEDMINEAHTLAESSVLARTDLARGCVSFDLVAPLAEQYGVVVSAGAPELESTKARSTHQPQKGKGKGGHGVEVPAPGKQDLAVPLRVLGPQLAASDVAAILWSRFVQGKLTSLVLQVPGTVQAMSKLMAADFERDLRDLEAECEVETHKGNTVMWVAGRTEEAVAQGRRMLQEMLSFYLPNEFDAICDVQSSVIEALRQDPLLRSSAAAKGCVIDFYSPDVADSEGFGSVWICGKDRSETRHRVRDSMQRAVDQADVLS